MRAQAEILVEEGVDLLVLEFLLPRVPTVKAMLSATAELGVPVWVSLSCLRDRDTNAVMFGIEESSESTDYLNIYGPLAGAV